MKILSVVALLALAAPLMAETAAEIYQKALAKEKGEGDFEAAISDYEAILRFLPKHGLAKRYLAAAKQGAAHQIIGRMARDDA